LSDTPHIYRIADLPTRKPTHFSIAPDAAARKALASDLDVPEVRKLRFEGSIAPTGGTDWVLTGQLGATVVQSCVITLAPVTTRIEEQVNRTYVAHLPEPEAAEVEMPEDDSVEPIPAVIDLNAVMAEALSLAIPAFPRADGAELGAAVYAADGVAPLTDEAAKPFAGLQALKDQMGKDKG